jgi:hypothetical protein
MKKTPAHFAHSTEIVDAYTPEDFTPSMDTILATAKRRWVAEWERQGSKDEGTCVMGKGIGLWYVSDTQLAAHIKTVIRFGHSQGNTSAYESVGAALDYLAEHGIKARYVEGNMD